MANLSNSTTLQLELHPQDAESELILRTYHSQVKSLRGAALREDKFISREVNVLLSERPGNLNESPNYARFTIAIHDTPLDDDKYNHAFDVLITAICTRNNAAPLPYFNLANIQGDIVPGLPKTVEYFYYFEYHNTSIFTRAFKRFILPRITTALDLTSQQYPLSKDFVGLNFGLGPDGLLLWYRNDSDLQDESFLTGQYRDSLYLGDPGKLKGRWWDPDWDNEFVYGSIDGVFIITAFSEVYADKFVKNLESEFSDAFEKKLLLKCKKADHFGYRSGVSNPQIEGVTFGTTAQPRIQYPGSPVVPMGAIVMGYEGDEGKDERPDWTKDGALMVTRKLNTLVPEFDAFLREQGPKIFPQLSVQDAADRLGARFFGRWKDGTPTELSPDRPDPWVSSNDKNINNFVFDESARQTRCPFAAHIRKSNPRGSISESPYTSFIRRQGMTFGPEVTRAERNTDKTIFERGQHFVCYASSIDRGFKEIQYSSPMLSVQIYSQQSLTEGTEQFNETMFPPGKDVTPGFDPIVGQPGELQKQTLSFITGTDPNNERRVMLLDKFIVPRGGAYLFVPSLSMLAQQRMPNIEVKSVSMLREQRAKEVERRESGASEIIG
ncbi:hypothetical protein C0991_007296 [Blastosporella zonata]|nr:hypothetical protein C0991_007296 [Blastosporella zonata]